MIVNKNDGYTLVEILASVVILTIIAFTFITIFIQSAKTNNLSENMMDATYIAQREMEKIYNISKTATSINEDIEALNYYNCNGNYCKDNDENDYYITLIITKDSETTLYKVLVKVYSDKSRKKLEVQIESLLNFDNVR